MALDIDLSDFTEDQLTALEQGDLSSLNETQLERIEAGLSGRPSYPKPPRESGLRAFGTGFVDEAAFGLPEFLTGGSFVPTHKSFGAQTAEGLGRVGGFFLGPGKLGRMAKGAVGRAAPFLAKSAAGRGALLGVEGATAMGSTAATTPQDIPTRAALGAATFPAVAGVAKGVKAVAPPFIRGVKSIPKLGGAKSEAFANRVVDAVSKGYDSLVEKYGARIAEKEATAPQTVVRAGDAVSGLFQEEGMLPRVQSLAKQYEAQHPRSRLGGLLTELAQNPDRVNQLTLTESQHLLNLARQGRDPLLKSVSARLREAQLEAFPEFAADKAFYRQSRSDLDATQAVLGGRRGNTTRILPSVTGEQGLFKEPVRQEAAKRALPSETMQEIGDVRRAGKLKQGAKTAAKGVAGYKVADLVFGGKLPF